ncbi:MAG: YraN family protein [Rikenellaceae bacterium]|jgi:putative endonuclease|nr:YraN family protein [Rikenellaceae bacterium]
MEGTKVEIGRQGEDLAQEYLMQQGFTLLYRNWRNGRYELDLVAEKEGRLHIVEVKTRQAGSLASPEEAYTRAKFRSLCRAAEYFIGLYRIDMEVQFDLIAVEHDPSGALTLRYIPEVMTPAW